MDQTHKCARRMTQVKYTDTSHHVYHDTNTNTSMWPKGEGDNLWTEATSFWVLVCVDARIVRKISDVGIAYRSLIASCCYSVCQGSSITLQRLAFVRDIQRGESMIFIEYRLYLTSFTQWNVSLFFTSAFFMIFIEKNWMFYFIFYMVLYASTLLNRGDKEPSSSKLREIVTLRIMTSQ